MSDLAVIYLPALLDSEFPEIKDMPYTNPLRSPQQAALDLQCGRYSINTGRVF